MRAVAAVPSKSTVPNRASASASVIRPTFSVGTCLFFYFLSQVRPSSLRLSLSAPGCRGSVPGAPAAALTTSVAPSS